MLLHLSWEAATCLAILCSRTVHRAGPTGPRLIHRHNGCRKHLDSRRQLSFCVTQGSWLWPCGTPLRRILDCAAWLPAYEQHTARPQGRVYSCFYNNIPATGVALTIIPVYPPLTPHFITPLAPPTKHQSNPLSRPQTPSPGLNPTP